MGSVQSCSIFHNLYLHLSILTIKRVADEGLAYSKPFIPLHSVALHKISQYQSQFLSSTLRLTNHMQFRNSCTKKGFWLQILPWRQTIKSPPFSCHPPVVGRMTTWLFYGKVTPLAWSIKGWLDHEGWHEKGGDLICNRPDHMLCSHDSWGNPIFSLSW